MGLINRERKFVRPICIAGYILSILVGLAMALTMAFTVATLSNKAMFGVLLSFVGTFVIAGYGCMFFWSMEDAFRFRDEPINLVHQIFMLILIPNIWFVIWVANTTDFFNRKLDGKHYSVVGELLLFYFVPFYSIYWFFVQGKRSDNLERSIDNKASKKASLYTVFAIFAPVAAAVMMQHNINYCIEELNGQ